jgi:hypothetical protein
VRRIAPRDRHAVRNAQSTRRLYVENGISTARDLDDVSLRQRYTREGPGRGRARTCDPLLVRQVL